MSDRNKAFELQQGLQENGISDTSVLEFLVNNWLSGSEALEAMQAALVEFGLDEEEDDEDYEDDNYDEYDDEDRFGEMI
jgi:hypothetical protein